ncbi:hypothetical protein FOG18_07655 [Legionella israelensis]|uniref:hypothetical protein n=1 Tax=Legionella israelensis TaxID=454 RepID=UPI0011803259|nr:hypothetical protein [Legionella israelensis]QDP72441.1 hypothetical protein FOG18_07655 [Legionella israelensis]
MPGFFNRENRFRTAMQIYNLSIASLALYNLLTDPEASFAELGPDIIIHVTSAISYQSSELGFTDIGSAALNFFRIGSIYTGVSSGCSSVSTDLNLADVGNHMANILTSIFAVNSEKEDNSETSDNTAPKNR